MRRPWTIDVTNLADHAVPLGIAINSWLWKNSPLHRAFAEWEQEALRAIAAERREQQLRMIANELIREIEKCGDSLASRIAVEAPFKAVMTRRIDIMSHDLEVGTERFRMTEYGIERAGRDGYQLIVERAAAVIARRFSDRIESAVIKAMLGDREKESENVSASRAFIRRFRDGIPIQRGRSGRGV